MNAPLPTAQLRQQLYRDMDPHHLTPLWEVLHALVPPQPDTPCVPALWKYDAVRPFLMRAGEVITAEEAVRRGVFGAPSFFVGDQLFFGQDRLDFVAEALAG